MKSQFPKRVVAFVDILGFSEIVRGMEANERLFATIRDALKSLDRQSRDFGRYRRELDDKREAAIGKGFAPLLRKSDLRMTAFSDCYVLSEVSPAWHVLAAVQALASRFLTEGILTRGGVTQGGAYHRERVLFGPAIIEAHKLESNVAKYPRILVSEAVRRAVWGYHEGLWKKRLLSRDVDGCWFVNLLVPSMSSWAALSDANAARDRRSHLEAVGRSLTAKWKEVRGNPEYMSKVWWLIHRYNSAAEKEGLEKIERGSDL